MTAVIAQPSMRTTRARILEGARAGVAAARRLHRPILVAIGVAPPDHRDPLDVYAAASARDRFFWRQPSRHAATAAIGVAVAIETSGDMRFAEASARAGALFADLIRVDGAAAPVRLVGGFAFDPQGAMAEHWRAFPDGALALPSLLYHQERGVSSVTLCRQIHPGDDAGAVASAIEHTLATAFGPIGAARQTMPDVVRRQEDPTASEWKRAVSDAIDAVRAGRLQKVVLARPLRLVSNQAFDDVGVVERLRAANPNATTFAIARGAARFVGATPELLVRLHGRAFETVALAGSIGRADDQADDLALARQLLASAKDRIEHEVVVRTILDSLAPVSTDVRRAAGTPRVERSRSVQHLATPISGTIADGCTALDLVGRLHPTPAAGGAPRDEALAFIRRHEPLARGWYAGPVGWIDANGDGEFVVALRSGLIDGAAATLFAGCGIVAASDPDAEYRETAMKFGPMLDALGLA
jgi:isochorismate synthase